MNEYKPRAGPPASPAPRPSPGDSATPQRPQLVMELPKHPEPDEPGLLYFPLNDHGNAQRVAAIYGPSMRYCHAFKKWLLWDGRRWRDRKSTRLNSSHLGISYAVFCLQKKNRQLQHQHL